MEDPKHPENVGKVFLFKYGFKIWKKIEEAMEGTVLEDGTVVDKAFYPFSPIPDADGDVGANFVMKVHKVDGQTSYDKCHFQEPSALYDGDEKKLQEVFDSLHSLSEFVDPKKYPTYENLEKRFIMVTGHDAEGNVRSSRQSQNEQYENVQESASEPESESDQSYGSTELNMESGETKNPLEALRELARDTE